MAASQEIYIRNPLAVLNVDLCGMQAPRLLRAVFLWILLTVVHPIPVLVTGGSMALCQRSLSHEPTVLLSHYPSYNDTVETVTTYVKQVLECSADSNVHAYPQTPSCCCSLMLIIITVFILHLSKQNYKVLHKTDKQIQN